MKSTSIGHRLCKHLEAAGLYGRESNHAFRQGQIQSMAALGMTRVQIGEVVQTKTLSIVDLYADATRHLPVCKDLQLARGRMACPASNCLAAMAMYNRLACHDVVHPVLKHHSSILLHVGGWVCFCYQTRL